MKLLQHVACALALGLGLSACGPDLPPVDKPPEPQATALSDAIHDPLDKAAAVQATLDEAARQQKAAVEAAAH